jgi:uncharacterized protein with GYD domain
MAKYILLVNWTDQGIRNIKDSAKRLDAGRALAKDHGCVLESFFMTMGSFDNVAVVESPDDETIAAQRAICAPSRSRLFPRKPIERSSVSWLRPDAQPLRRLRPGARPD